MTPSLKYALAGYGLLAALAALTLDGKLRLFLWLFLGALAIKSWIAARQSN